MTALFRITDPWLTDSDSDDLIALRDHIMWLKKELFDNYEPNQFETFDDRLAVWLNNINLEDERKSLFRLLNHVFFVGKQQFDALCRVAYKDSIIRWLIDNYQLDISDVNLSATINALTKITWFCPITDSMRINSFLKVNQLRGHDHRPDWRSLEVFADPVHLRAYVVNEGIQRLVLLEDFVGSGDQIRSTVAWAAAAFPTMPILVIPLVCCPGGVQAAIQLSALYPNVTFAPTLVLRSELFLSDTHQPNEPTVFSEVREIIIRVRARLGEWQTDPFGWDATGALVALYSNCPDNTLPIIHHSGPQWTPLFSRIRRS